MTKRARAKEIARRVFGERPLALLFLMSPTLLAIVMDVALRWRSMIDFPPKEWLNYFGSSFAACGFWGGPMWLAARLFGSRARYAKPALAAIFGLLFFPFACFEYGGQALYYGVFHAYIARDTVRLGVHLRGTLLAWMQAWSAGVVIMVVGGLVATAIVAYFVRKATPSIARAWPLLPAIGFLAACVAFWVDFVESRALQAAPPDTCFIHGVVTAIRHQVTRRHEPERGVSIREPDPLPPLTPAPHRPNVVVILTESVRADAVCSDPTSGCKAPFLDDAARDRISLGRLTSQASGTFTACMILWTGLPPNVDIVTAHKAPMLWELAKAVGYETAYITAQNLRYEDLAAYVKRAGIDVQASAVDFGDTHDPHVGAPDEKATARALEFIHTVPAGTPYFALVHLSNTHWPYRIDPALQPHEPHSENPLGPTPLLHNHYLNSVAMQERTVTDFLRQLRATPGWDDTVVLFLSDHGEEFGEHGRLYHLNNVFDEEVRIPGWLLAGPKALSDDQRHALAGFSHRRTYTQDVQATVVDLFGLFDQHSSFPYANLTTGRSLLRAGPPGEPTMLLSTTSGVWEDDDPNYGVMRGERLLVGSERHPWWCFQIERDPGENRPQADTDCGDLVGVAAKSYPGVKVPPP
jgi:glucan phosphoethanolaminetransferase (alkaline phosphatase superfamily)